jgi:hypothetical protein
MSVGVENSVELSRQVPVSTARRVAPVRRERAVAIGAMAIGAVALGALAIGTLAIGQLVDEI